MKEKIDSLVSSIIRLDGSFNVSATSFEMLSYVVYLETVDTYISSVVLKKVYDAGLLPSVIQFDSKMCLVIDSKNTL